MVLDGLYAKSKAGYSFRSLMKIIMSRDNILLAYRNIKKNRGSHTKGTDGSTITTWAAMQPDEMVDHIRGKLGNYFPKSIRRVEIPKPDGRKRPLGIPTIGDRLVQQCILQILEPICEAKFFKHSYGFRPLRSAHHAVARAYFLAQVVHLHYVVDIDIKGFFDNIHHGKLLKQLWTIGIRDKSLLKVISKMLKAEIQGIGIPKKGTPQGGILSPLLANVVLNELDWWIASQWERYKSRHSYVPQKKTGSMCAMYESLKRTSTLKEVYIVRYADDFKLFCRNHNHAKRIFIAVKKWLSERLALEISPNKSAITNLRKGYSDFLGIKFKVRPKGSMTIQGKKRTRFVAISHVADKAQANITTAIRKYVNRLQHPNSGEELTFVNDYNSYVFGVHSYYSCAIMCSKNFSEIAFLSHSMHKNRLILRRRKPKEPLPRFIEKYYGKSKRLRFVYDKPLVPISYVQFNNCRQCKQLSPYIADHRNLVHKNQRAVTNDAIRYLLRNPVRDKSVEYNDNRLSAFVGQYGRCFVTGESLKGWQVHCHHKVPLYLGGNDTYSNLVIVSNDVHKLIHATMPVTIAKCQEIISLKRPMIVKINTLREKLQLSKIL